MTGNTLIIDAFWVSNKYFPSALNPTSKEGHEFYTQFSTKARYLGWMDLVQLRNIIKNQNISHIILQNLETLGKISQKLGYVKVCTTYECNHIMFNTFSNIYKRKHCNPFFEEAVIGGFSFNSNDELCPGRLEHYLRFLILHTSVQSITCTNNKIKITVHRNEFNKIIFDVVPNL